MALMDVLVIGGGNAALCAALMAREAGATVSLLEAAPRELVFKRPVDPLGAPLPRQGPMADPAPVAVGRPDVRRP